jgi:hypothetical protein
VKDASSIIDLFHRVLYIKLMEHIHDNTRYLIEGAAKSYDDYRYKVGYLQGLTHVIELCEEIENDRYGRKPASREGE